MIEWDIDEELSIGLQKVKCKMSGVEYSEDDIKDLDHLVYFEGVKYMVSRELFLAKHVIPNIQFENYKLASDLIIDNVMSHMAYSLKSIIESENEPIED